MHRCMRVTGHYLPDTSKPRAPEVVVSVLLTRVFCSTGHVGKHGHEFLDFEYSSGRLRYANSSNYRNDTLIRKESACHRPSSFSIRR